MVDGNWMPETFQAGCLMVEMLGLRPIIACMICVEARNKITSLVSKSLLVNLMCCA